MESAVPAEKGDALSTDENGAGESPVAPSGPVQVSLWEWDLRTNQFYSSVEFRRQLGTGEAALNSGLSDLEARLHPRDRERVKESLSRFLTSAEPCYEAQYRLRSKDDTYHWMRLRAELIHDPNGRPCRIVGYQHDISEQEAISHEVAEQRRADTAAQQAAEQLQEQAALLELAPLLVRDMDNRIVLWTKGAERLYGFSKAEALGRVSHDLFQTGFEQEMGYVDEMLRSVGQWEGELVYRKSDGERLVVASQQIVYRDSAGRPVRILEVNADITSLKSAEKSLRESETALTRSAEQLRALATGLQQAREKEAIRIARELHDQLGRCLTALKMDVDGIQRALASEVSAGKNFGAVIERVRRMNETLDETVQTVRRISAELRPGILDDLGLAAAIEWQTKDFQARSGVNCMLRLPEKDLELNRDQATALFRIFQESLTNVARHARAAKVWVNLSEEEGAVVLEIEDDGVGISPERLAERHSLGLLGMRERVAVFGGEIEFSGVPGQGTVVVVRMPLRQ
jgi:PAS domain S-box-containing protein